MGAFTPLDSATVSALAAEYGLYLSGFRLLPGGVENTNVKLAAREGNFVLTVLEKKDLGAAAAYAAYLSALAGADLPIPQVMRRQAGGHVACHSGKPVIVTRYVHGRCLDPLPARLLPRAGSTLARVHGARDISCALTPYLRLGAASLNEIASFADREFADWMLRCHRRTRYVVESGGDQVPTHGDLFADNIIVRGADDLVFVDWDDGSADYPWVDVGMAILGLCCRREFVPGRARLLLAGYQTGVVTRLDLALVRDAVIYVALFTAYNRYRRRGASRSYAESWRSYQAIPGVVASLQGRWADVSA